MKPPMNDAIVLHVIQYDEYGNPKTDRNGRPERGPIQSAARVKLTAERIFSTSGEEEQATLEISLPPETPVADGDIVEWVDQFQRLHSGPIRLIKDVLNYNGLEVYYRKAWTV